MAKEEANLSHGVIFVLDVQDLKKIGDKAYTFKMDNDIVEQ